VRIESRKAYRVPAAEPQDQKERQACKIKELADALVTAGFVSLDEQAKALGLSRSTTWTILQAKHKNYGLSGALISRVLAKPDLDSRVRAKIIEYVRERAAGAYGHNGTQLRRFIQLFTADVHALTFATIDTRRSMPRPVGQN
jgi:hypothetical protein